MLRSEGGLGEEQRAVLGVYRLADQLAERPVFRQEGGEHWLYHCPGSGWLLGTTPGQQYGWVRNFSKQAGLVRWPSDLAAGWEYRCAHHYVTQKILVLHTSEAAAGVMFGNVWN